MRALVSVLLLLGAAEAAAQPFAYIPNSSSNNVSVVDTATNTVTVTIPVGSSPWGVELSPDASIVLITNMGSDSVSVINTASQAVVATIPVGDQPYTVTFSPDGSEAYVPSFGAGTVTVINMGTLTVSGTIPGLAAGIYHSVVSADGSKLYVGNFGSGDVSVIDTATNTVSNTIVGANPSALHLALSPDGARLYVGAQNFPQVAVISTASETVIGTITTSSGPAGLVASNDGSRLYTANRDNQVQVVDTATLLVTNSMTVTGSGWGIDLSADDSLVYVSDVNNGSLAVFNTTTFANVANIPVGGNPYATGNFLSPAFYGVPAIPGGVALDASPAAPLTYADEIIATPGAPVTLLNPAGDLNLSAPLGYNFSAGEVRYARFECDNGLRFRAGSTSLYDGAGNASLGAINGLGGSSLHFSVTANDNTVVADDRLVVTGERSITGTDNVTCRYSLYDFPSQAAAGGASGRVYTVAGPYLRFAASYALAVDSEGNPVANVESADPAFSEFDGAGPTNDPSLGQIGGFSYGTRFDMTGAVQPLTPAGVMMTLVDLMDSDTALVFEGDFDAANDVFLSTNADCSVNVQSADDFDATEAVFVIGSTDALDYFLCFEAGGTPIPVGTYTVSLDAISAAPAVYAVTDIGPLDLGEITRNGTELQAPLAQVPSGYLSRMVLTNTGSQARGYVIEVLGETGNVISTANLTGSIPAGKTTVVDLTTVLTGFTGAPRATLNVTIAGPNNQIQGLYQIVNPNSGTVSNHVMVRPGLN